MKPPQRERRSARAASNAPGEAHRPGKWIAWLRNDALVFAAVVLLAFALRVIYISQLRDSPLFEYPRMDARYHDQWAQAIVAGETFMEGPYFRAPLYSFFLAAVYKVFGHGYLVPRLLQSLLGSVSCGMVFLIGRRAFSRTVGVLGAFVAATYWILIYFDAELLIPPLIVFLDLLMMWLLLRASEKPGGLSYGLAGLVMGLSAIARPNVLLYAPAVVVWLAVRYRPAWRRITTYAGCFVLGCVIPVLPVTVRNYLVGDDLVLIASQGGVNFFIGNNPESDGTTAIVPGSPGGWWEGYRATRALADRRLGRSLKPSEVSGYYYGQALEFFRSQPLKALALTAHKLRLFWNREEISNNKNIYFWTARYTPLVRLLPLGFGVIGPLGILGLALCWRRRQELFPVWGFVLVYMASIVMFFCTARYRTPILGPLMLLAAHALVCLITAARQARWWNVVGQLAVLIPAALFVNSTPPQNLGTNDSQSLMALAWGYRQHGQDELALESFRAAVRADPRSLTARFELGTRLAQVGLASEALEQFRVALSLASNLRLGETPALVGRVHLNLASVLSRRGENEAAVRHYRRAIELDPAGGDSVAYFNLGSTLAGLGRDQEAIEALQEAVARNPDYQDAQYNLAWVLKRSGRLDQAVVHFREVVRIDPQDADAWYQLGGTLAEEGRRAEAVEALQHSVQLRPNEAAAVDQLSKAMIRDNRYAEAIDVLDASLALEDERLINRLAWLLAACPDDELRDGNRAVRYATQLCPEVARCSAEHLDTLAAALAEAGQFDQAADVARQAVEKARTAGQEELARAIAARLQLYQAARPYRHPVDSE